MNTAKHLQSLIDRHAAPICVGKKESHTPVTLSRRIGAPVSVCQQLVSRGILTPLHELYSGNTEGPLCFNSDDLNRVKREVALEIVARTVEQSNGTDDAIRFAAHHALTRTFARPEEEKDPRLADRLGKAAAVVGTGAALAGGAAWLRGRLGAGANRAGKLGILKTAGLGGRLLKKDANGATQSAVDLIKSLRRAKPSAFPRA